MPPRRWNASGSRTGRMTLRGSWSTGRRCCRKIPYEKGAWYRLFRQGTAVISGFGYFAKRAEADAIPYFKLIFSLAGFMDGLVLFLNMKSGRARREDETVLLSPRQRYTEEPQRRCVNRLRRESLPLMLPTIRVAPTPAQPSSLWMHSLNGRALALGPSRRKPRPNFNLLPTIEPQAFREGPFPRTAPGSRERDCTAKIISVCRNFVGKTRRPVSAVPVISPVHLDPESDLGFPRPEADDGLEFWTPR